jgi:tetratricopeptide (TPR) repeat protein
MFSRGVSLILNKLLLLSTASSHKIYAPVELSNLKGELVNIRISIFISLLCAISLSFIAAFPGWTEDESKRLLRMVNESDDMPVPKSKEKLAGDDEYNPEEADKREKKAESLFLKGHEALNSGDVRKAEKLYRKAIALNPEAARYNRQLAIILAYQHRGQEAERCILYALQADPEDWRSLITLGTFYSAQDRLHEQAEIYKKALKLIPEGKKYDSVRNQLSGFIKEHKEYKQKVAEHKLKTKQREKEILDRALEQKF